MVADNNSLSDLPKIISGSERKIVQGVFLQFDSVSIFELQPMKNLS